MGILVVLAGQVVGQPGDSEVAGRGCLFSCLGWSPLGRAPQAVPCGNGSSHPCSPGLPGQCAPSFPKLHKPPAAPPFPTAAHPSTPHCTAGDGAQPQEWGVQQGQGYSGGWSVGELRDVGHSER